MELSVLDVSHQIMKAIKELALEGNRMESDNLIQKKADAMANYDKSIAVASAELKLKGESVSIIRDLAKGRASDALHDKIIAEEMLKAHYSKIDRLQSMLNGLQSVYKHLSVVDNVS